MTEKRAAAPARKAPAKRAAKKTAAPARKRGPITAPKPPAVDAVEVKEEVPAVSEEVETPENDDKPKRGRRPNVVGQANARFVKARVRLEKAQKKAARVQAVNDELKAAETEFEEAQAEYRTAFEASLNLPGVGGDSADDDGDDEE